MVQVSCNQRYESKGTAAFQACAVTEQNCVAKKYDEDLYPTPPKSVLVSEFDTTKYKVSSLCLFGMMSHACVVIMLGNAAGEACGIFGQTMIQGASQVATISIIGLLPDVH